MATVTSSPQERLHAWSLDYVRLKSIVLLMRSLNSLRPLIHSYREPLFHEYKRHVVDLPSRDAGRTIRVHIYRSTRASSSTPLPVHISWHGSGFVLPNLGDDHAFIATVVKELGPDFVLIDADYRKAPEHPFPAASHDAQDIVNYVLSQPDVYDQDRITLGGFSAGGNLALAIGAQLGPSRIAGITALYPPVDFTIKPGQRPLPTKDKADSGFALPTWMSNVFVDSYFVDDQDKKHPLCSVYYMDAARFPSLLLACGQVDTLHAASEKLTRKLKQAGRTDVRFISFPNEGHGFDKMPRSPASHYHQICAYGEFANFIRDSWQRDPKQLKAQL